MQTELTKGMISFNNGFNLKDEVLKEINKRNFKQLPKLRFHIESPYQKKRYKSQFVFQEVWVFIKGNPPILIEQESWENLDYKESIISDLMHSIQLINS